MKKKSKKKAPVKKLKKKLPAKKSSKKKPVKNKKKQNVKKTQKKSYLLKKLREAKIKNVTLEDFKKYKDSKFRSAAKKEALVPVTDLNPEIRLKKKSIRGKKSEIEAQKNKIRELQKNNKKIEEKAFDLKEEYVFSEPERKKEIEKLLAKPDYKKKDLSVEKNYLKALEGKDFDFIVNDGFQTYKINTKELGKYWKKGQNATLPILKKMKKNANESVKFYDNLIKKEKKTASKSRLKKLRKIRDAIQKKLKHVINKNIESVQTGNYKYLDEVGSEGEKAYSILFRVVGFTIDRIGI